MALEEAKCIYVDEHTEEWHSIVNKVAVDLLSLSKQLKVY
jgi:hypothetical protein